MGTKNNPGRYDCFSSAAPDEPMFVLLGRDPMAAVLVRLWAMLRCIQGEETAKINEAMACALALENYAKGLGKAPTFLPQCLSAIALMIPEERGAGTVFVEHPKHKIFPGPDERVGINAERPDTGRTP
jgi:hypothetical protein